MTRIASRPPRLRAGAPLPAYSTASGGGAGLALEIHRIGSQSRVVVSGELDLAGRELLEALLAHVRASSAGPIEVDLGQVPFADIHGLEPLLGPGVVVVAASPAVLRLPRYLDVPLRLPGGPARAAAGD